MGETKPSIPVRNVGLGRHRPILTVESAPGYSSGENDGTPILTPTHLHRLQPKKLKENIDIVVTSTTGNPGAVCSRSVPLF